MFDAELLQGRIEALEGFALLIVVHRVLVAREPLQAVTGQLAFLDDMHALPCEAPPLVDEQVVHNTAQPGPRFVDVHEIVELAVGPDQQFLEQVLRLRLMAGQAEREPVEPIEMRPDALFESLLVTFAAYWLSLTNFARSSLYFTSDG